MYYLYGILDGTTKNEPKMQENLKSKNLTPGFYYRCADKSLARPARKQATFPTFCGTWRFITTFTRVHHLSVPEPNQSISLPFTLLIGAACFLPGRAKDLSAPRFTAFPA